MIVGTSINIHECWCSLGWEKFLNYFSAVGETEKTNENFKIHKGDKKTVILAPCLVNFFMIKKKTFVWIVYSGHVHNFHIHFIIEASCVVNIFTWAFSIVFSFFFLSNLSSIICNSPHCHIVVLCQMNINKR